MNKKTLGSGRNQEEIVMGNLRLSARAGRLLAAAAGVILAVAMAVPAAAAPGDLDTSFGSGGRVTTDFGPISVASAVARSSDGKIVAAGRVGDALTGDFGVARYTSDGTLDTSFGTGGIVTTPFTDLEDAARALAIQSDGKIVVGGFSGAEAGLTGDFALARYNPNGTLDTSFGRGGKVTTDLSGGLGDALRGMAILPDGKILAVGAGGNWVGLARYNPDGSLDASFGVTGKEIVRIGNSANALGLAVLGSGRFLVAGLAANTLTQDDYLLARFNPNGSLDTTFGTGGWTTTDFAGPNDLAFGLTVQPDGKIVVVGTTNSLDLFGSTGDVKFGIARYTSDGTLETSFGVGGQVQINPTPAADGLRGVVLQTDRKILISGFVGEAIASFQDPMIGDFGVARLNADGSLDTSFGTGGVVRTNFAAGGDGGRAIIAPTNNKIIVAGAATTNHLNFALAQYSLSEELSPAARAVRLRLSVRPRTARAGRRTAFRFGVVAGPASLPVAAATISFVRRRARTDARGRAVLTTTLPRPGRYRARATKAGMRPATVTVRALRARSRGRHA